MVNRSLEDVVLNAVVFFGFFRVVPAVGCADEVQIVIAELFISTSSRRREVQHIFSRVAASVARSRGDIISIAMRCP